MTDDLDKLRDALQSPPAPDAARRASVMAAAQENFDATQEFATPARPTKDRPHSAGRIWTRMFDMVSNAISRPVLMAGSSLAVLMIAAVVITPMVTKDDLVVHDSSLVGIHNMVTPGTGRERAATDAELAPLAMEPAPAPSDAIAAKRVRQQSEMMEARPAATGNALTTLNQQDTRLMRLDTDNAIAIDDRFPTFEKSGLSVTAETPVSTFSVDVDTTSYALWRMSVLDGYPLPPEAIRVEEMINYFDYAYPAPGSTEVPFTTSVAVTQTPWNPGTRLMQIGIHGYDVAPQDRPPMGLVFLIDTSGSMNDPKKLPLLKKSFSLLLGTLRDEDTVAIVTYAGSAGTVLEPTQAADEAAILGALDRLGAGGSTAGQAGLQQAYGLAETMVEAGQSARVILATDGDFNVGISDPDALRDYVATKRETGVSLSVLGFGRGNYTDTIMQALAQNGNGVAAYIDTLAEAQKVLVEEVTGSLMTIASDVKIQVEFNPAQISEYRLIGYETRALNREDFNDDRVDAGDIGAGHSVTAIYEVTPAGSEAELVDPLRYGTAPDTASDEWAFVKLRYKQPGADESQLIETPVTAGTNGIAPDVVNFATAVAGAARLIRGEDLGDWSLSDAATLAASAQGADPFGHRGEFLRLVRLAAAQSEN